MTDRYELGKPKGKERLIAALADAPPRLDLAVLAIATLGNPEVDVSDALYQLDALARKVAAHGGGESSLQAVLSEEGFAGDESDYDAPENSYLDRVLERKTGLPILLSVLWIEVGRRAGIEALGIGLPGHFVVGFRHEDGLQVRDPFRGGPLLTFAECAALVSKHAKTPLSPRMLEPVSPAAIIWRMLNNLKASFGRRNDDAKLLEVIDLMLVLMPDHPLQLLHRAELLTGLGAFGAALKDIEACQQLATFPDPDRLERIATQLKARLGEIH